MNFSVGELIIYSDNDVYEIGKVESLCTDGAYVYYTEDKKTHKTPYENMHHLLNKQCIHKTYLGSGVIKER